MIHSAKDSPAFTDEAWITVFKSLYEHQMRISSGYTHGNWLYVELNGMASATVVTPVFKKTKQWRDEVEQRLLSAMESMVYPDGWQYELAPGYMGLCMGCAREIEQTFRAYGLRFSDKFYSIIDSMVDCYVKCTMANGTIPPINDSGSGSCKSYIRDAVAAYGGSDGARWFATDGKEGALPEFKSVLMPYAGFVALRTGWGEDEVSAFFDAGTRVIQSP
jgi:heparan-sulfate lyase